MSFPLYINRIPLGVVLEIVKEKSTKMSAKMAREMYQVAIAAWGSRLMRRSKWKREGRKRQFLLLTTQFRSLEK